MARILLTFNDSFTIFSIESVDINKIMVVFYHLLVHGFQLKIILTLTNVLNTFFLQLFREDSEIQDGCRGHMTTPFHKKGFFHLAISGIYAMQAKKV
jgi:hypothetical protein